MKVLVVVSDGKKNYGYAWNRKDANKKEMLSAVDESIKGMQIIQYKS